MENNVIKNVIKNKIEELLNEPNSIVVLKGIPVAYVDSSIEKVDLSKVVEDKMGYFMSVYTRRKVISYEEFLLIADFVVSQYKSIFVLSNNIYMEQFPVEECFAPEIREGLIKHFEELEEVESDETYLGDIEEYVSIFAGLKEYNGYLVGAYNRIPVLDSNKIVDVNLFDYQTAEPNVVSDNPEDFIDLVEESDYIDFVKLLFTEPDEIYLRISNYTGDINKLRDHIALLSFYWKDYSEIYYVQAQIVSGQYQHRNEYNERLKKY